MTLEEKAKSVVFKYMNADFNCKGCDIPFCDVGCTSLSKEESKQCAMLEVEGIKEYISENLLNEDSAIHIIYLNKLQQKIKDL